MEQLERLAEALQTIHNFQIQGKPVFYQHGNLKPENILVFGTGRDDGVGLWKMTDLSHARIHLNDTEEKQRVALGPSSVIGHGTIFYRPPEAVLSQNRQISRLYDTWCMGCIALQYIIWLLYGYQELMLFLDGLYDPMSNVGMFWECNDGVQPRIHSKAIRYMDKAKEDLSRGFKSPAIAALLEVVRTGLLICQVAGEPALQRMSARELSNELNRIRSQGQEMGPFWWPSRSVTAPLESTGPPNSPTDDRTTSHPSVQTIWLGKDSEVSDENLTTLPTSTKLSRLREAALDESPTTFPTSTNLSVLSEEAPGNNADADDNSTTYSGDTTSELHEMRSRYEAEIVADLVKSLSQNLNNADGVERVINALPDHLQAFARKLGAEKEQRRYREVMRHVYKNRWSVLTDSQSMHAYRSTEKD